MNEPICLLCNARGASHRNGRLGRYAQTCDRCENRRGAHLEHAVTGAGGADHATGPVRALQWTARPR